MQKNAEVLKLLNELPSDLGSGTRPAGTVETGSTPATQGADKTSGTPEQYPAPGELDKVVKPLIKALQKDAESTERAVLRKDEYWIALIITGIILVGIIVVLLWALTTDQFQMFITSLVVLAVLCVPCSFMAISAWESWKSGDTQPKKKNKEEEKEGATKGEGEVRG